MIVEIGNKKIKKIKIGDFFPEKGQISCPYDWGTEEVSRFIKNIKEKTENEIDYENPNQGFELLEIK